MARRRSRPVQLLPRLRVMLGDDIALGPGKADLLQAIRETGSIASAARSLGMSYMRAWSMVRTMNGCFESPLVEAVRGGTLRGGASLTRRGSAVLALYRKMDAASRRAVQPHAGALRGHLRGEPSLPISLTK